MQLTKENEQELIRLKQYFPFRVVFGVKHKDGKFESFAMYNRLKGKVFLGYCIVIDGELRIWNDDSMGQSYPASDCVPILSMGKYTFDIGNGNYGIDHLYDEKGNIIYHCHSVTDIYYGLKYNNAMSIGKWEYDV